MRINLPGYARLAAPGAAGIILESCRAAIESILASETLYSYAARQATARRFAGRAPVYGIDLPGESDRIVVRRSMRGGVWTPLGTDLFFPPTRGLRELVTSLRLREGGVQTPEVVGFIGYRAGPLLRRTDVVTREISGGSDLASALAGDTDGDQRRHTLEAAAGLVSALSRNGGHHSDLNARNILITRGGHGNSPETQAHVLDVDRIRFHIPGDPIVLGANTARLVRSMRKLRDRGELAIDDSEIETLRARAAELAR